MSRQTTALNLLLHILNRAIDNKSITMYKVREKINEIKYTVYYCKWKSHVKAHNSYKSKENGGQCLSLGHCFCRRCKRLLRLRARLRARLDSFALRVLRLLRLCRRLRDHVPLRSLLAPLCLIRRTR